MLVGTELRTKHSTYPQTPVREVDLDTAISVAPKMSAREVDGHWLLFDNSIYSANATIHGRAEVWPKCLLSSGRQSRLSRTKSSSYSEQAAQEAHRSRTTEVNQRQANAGFVLEVS